VDVDKAGAAVGNRPQLLSGLGFRLRLRLGLGLGLGQQAAFRGVYADLEQTMDIGLPLEPDARLNGEDRGGVAAVAAVAVGQRMAGRPRYTVFTDRFSYRVIPLVRAADCASSVGL